MLGPVGATFHGLLHFADGGEVFVHFGPVGGIEMFLHGLRLGGYRIENAAVLGEDLPLGLLAFVHLEEQVENLAGGIDLMHG